MYRLPLTLLLICFFAADFSPENTSLTSNVIGSIVNVSQVFNITCSTEANPPAEFRFYADGKRLSNITTGNNTAVYTASVNERRSPVSYSCIPSNDYGNGLTRTITVIVHCKFAIYQKCFLISSVEIFLFSIAMSYQG